jgi:hypothetical protein
MSPAKLPQPGRSCEIFQRSIDAIRARRDAPFTRAALRRDRYGSETVEAIICV